MFKASRKEQNRLKLYEARQKRHRVLIFSWVVKSRRFVGVLEHRRIKWKIFHRKIEGLLENLHRNQTFALYQPCVSFHTGSSSLTCYGYGRVILRFDKTYSNIFTYSKHIQPIKSIDQTSSYQHDIASNRNPGTLE